MEAIYIYIYITFGYYSHQKSHSKTPLKEIAWNPPRLVGVGEWESHCGGGHQGGKD